MGNNSINRRLETGTPKVNFGSVAQVKAEVLRELAKELATLTYVRPGEPGREEYEAMLAIRRGNTDAWLKKRADEIEKGES